VRLSRARGRATVTEVIVVPSKRFAGEYAADLIDDLVARTPAAVVGLATGSSPQPVYEALARRAGQGADLARVRWFALDEYIGLPPDHPQSFRSVIDREVVRPLGLDPLRVSVPDGDRTSTAASAAAYERQLVDAGGVDLQLLGIGTDGHIGFNEPGSSLASTTRTTALTPQTIADNSRFFEPNETVPTHSMTQGVGTILRAGHLVLLAFGSSKAAAVARAVEGPVSSSTPASAIQLHPRATVLVDADAAGCLEHASYYDHAYRTRL
jgi:glucosamine-6-phosphate deaminase